MYLHLWGVGLRISEVCTLKGNAYYLQGKDAWIQVYQTKMRTYKRIPIPMTLYRLMQVYITKYQRKAEEYIFQNRNGGAYRKTTFQQTMKRLCEECNIQNGEYLSKVMTIAIRWQQHFMMLVFLYRVFGIIWGMSMKK